MSLAVSRPIALRHLALLRDPVRAVALGRRDEAAGHEVLDELAERLGRHVRELDREVDPPTFIELYSTINFFLTAAAV